MWPLVEAELDLEAGRLTGARLPDQLELHDEELALKFFPYMETFGWRKLPSEIGAEDPDLMDDLLKLRTRKANMKELLREERNSYPKGRGGKNG